MFRKHILLFICYFFLCFYETLQIILKTIRRSILLIIQFYVFIVENNWFSATNIEWLVPEAVLKQFVSPDDEHDVLETCRNL